MAEPGPTGAAAEIRRLFDFAVELDKLKSVLRRSRPVGVERYENSAEHSWHVALLALLLARHSAQPVDVARAVEILLVHDVPEIDSGDRFVYSRDPVSTAVDEAAAAERIFGLLPPEQGERLLARWREYEERKTPEALLAYAADRLMPVLHNLRGGGRSWREHDVPMESVKAVNSVIGAACPAVWAELEPMIDAFFAQLAPTED
jgi:putative hydrolase of HD superfamily